MKNKADINSVFVVWQDNITREWHPVGKLTTDGSTYRFNYTKGADASPRFKPFLRMEELNKVYESDLLFPFFSNRVLSQDRPEFQKLSEWIALSKVDSVFNPLEFLSKTGGVRGTDSFRIIPCPQGNKGIFEIDFFVHGIRYLSEIEKVELDSLSVGDKLELFLETDNEYDKYAIMLKKQGIKLGYCPRYLAQEFRSVLGSEDLQGSSIVVTKINLDAPSNFKVLCRFISEWPENHVPFLHYEYLSYTG